jgi:hypothetical protein
MNLLSVVVPAVREMRGPLISGYVYLLSLWIAFGERVPARTELEPGSVGDLLARAADLVGSPGVVAAASIAAYLVGSLVHDVLVASARREPRRNSTRFKLGRGLQSQDLSLEELDEALRQMSEALFRLDLAMAGLVLTVVIAVRLGGEWWPFLLLAPLLLGGHALVILHNLRAGMSSRPGKPQLQGDEGGGRASAPPPA